MLYYHNEITHEWTTNHNEAVAWFNNGYAVELNEIDPETGALEKCAEWVWQKNNCPSGGDNKMSLPDGHIRQIAQYLSRGHCARNVNILNERTNVLVKRAARFRPL